MSDLNRKYKCETKACQVSVLDIIWLICKGIFVVSVYVVCVVSLGVAGAGYTVGHLVG